MPKDFSKPSDKGKPFKGHKVSTYSYDEFEENAIKNLEYVKNPEKNASNSFTLENLEYLRTLKYSEENFEKGPNRKAFEVNTPSCFMPQDPGYAKIPEFSHDAFEREAIENLQYRKTVEKNNFKSDAASQYADNFEKNAIEELTYLEASRIGTNTPPRNFETRPLQKAFMDFRDLRNAASGYLKDFENSALQSFSSLKTSRLDTDGGYKTFEGYAQKLRVRLSLNKKTSTPQSEDKYPLEDKYPHDFEENAIQNFGAYNTSADDTVRAVTNYKNLDSEKNLAVDVFSESDKNFEAPPNNFRFYKITTFLKMVEIFNLLPVSWRNCGS